MHFREAGSAGRGGDGSVEGLRGAEEALVVCSVGALGGGVVDVVEEGVESCFGGVDDGAAGCGWEGGHGGDWALV